MASIELAADALGDLLCCTHCSASEAGACKTAHRGYPSDGTSIVNVFFLESDQVAKSIPAYGSVASLTHGTFFDCIARWVQHSYSSLISRISRIQLLFPKSRENNIALSIFEPRTPPPSGTLAVSRISRIQSLSPKPRENNIAGGKGSTNIASIFIMYLPRALAPVHAAAVSLECRARCDNLDSSFHT